VVYSSGRREEGRADHHHHNKFLYWSGGEYMLPVVVFKHRKEKRVQRAQAPSLSLRSCLVIVGQ